MAGEKTEKATPKRKQDERKKGNVSMSQDLVSVATLFASFFAMKSLSTSASVTLSDCVRRYLTMAGTKTAITPVSLRQFWIDGCTVFAKTALPLLLLCVLVATAATMGQTRGLFSMKSLEFKGERINPISGFKKMFSMRGLVELLKSILKVSVFAYVIYDSLQQEISLLPRLSDMTFVTALAYTGQLIYNLVIKAGVIFLFIVVGDVLYQRYSYEKNLRMSKQDIKDEYKQVEGDPQVKGRQRSIAQQRSQARMMQAVPDADVVIRNPTHYAVAIKYEQDKQSAPVVVAKGADHIALRIVSIAEEHDVYITEDVPLARALYAATEIGQEIPAEFFRPVAKLLAFVYRLKQKGLQG